MSATPPEGASRPGSLRPPSGLHALRRPLAAILSRLRGSRELGSRELGSRELGSRELGDEHSAPFPLIEVLLVVAMMGTAAAIGVPEYLEALDRARVHKAIGDIVAMGEDLRTWYFDNGAYPPTLAAIGYAGLTDPWGNPYVYIPIDVGAGGGEGGGRGGGDGMGSFRKDHFMVPLNSDFDLWSSGKDGESVPSLTAKQSRDDIVRASNGAFVGRAENF